MRKLFYFKNKFLDFQVRIFFLDIKLYLNGFISIIFSIFKPYNYSSILNLLKKNNSENILIIELNKFHSEIFPSWLFYLKNLGYDNKINFIASSDIHKLNPFLFLENNTNNAYNFYKMDPRIIIILYSLGFFRKFKKVIFNSEIFYFSPIDHYTHLLDLLTNKKNLKNSLFLCHNVLQTMVAKNNLIDKNNQLLTISPSSSKHCNIKLMMPLINNNTQAQNSSKEITFNELKSFISCGNIKINCKDSAGLISALEKTKDIKKTVNIIGKVPKKLMNNNSINYYPNLPFLELKSVLEKSHFVLFLLNENISYQYKFNNLSGSFPLALNFNLIPIIEESFAELYCLNEENSVIYKNGELDKAIKFASSLKYEKYILMLSELDKVKQNFLNKSLENLKNKLDFVY
jgi:hypothetical protein